MSISLARASSDLELLSTPSFMTDNCAYAVTENSQNTLAYSSGDQLCVVHFPVNGYSIDSGSVIDRISLEMNHVTNISYVELDGASVLVILGSYGIKVYNKMGTYQMWSITLPEIWNFLRIDSGECDLRSHYVIGLAVDGESNILFVGTSIGSILAIKNQKILKRLQSADSSLISSHRSNGSIACLACNSRYMISIDEEGNLEAFDQSQDYRNALMVPVSEEHKGDLCTTLCITDNLLIGGFTSGHIRVYKIVGEEVSLLMEIAAHARAVTGFALHPNKELLASCSDDQGINVWELRTFESDSHVTRAKVVFNDVINDNVLTGVAWLQDDRLLVSAYDNAKCTVYTIN
jgi:WD40 repeat protein